MGNVIIIYENIQCQKNLDCNKNIIEYINENTIRQSDFEKLDTEHTLVKHEKVKLNIS